MRDSMARPRRNPDPQLRTTVTELGEVTILALEGELDLATTSHLTAAIARAKHALIVIDLSGVQFIDVCGLRTLLTAKDRSDNHIRLVSASESVRRLLKLIDALQPVRELGQRDHVSCLDT